jgi:hypothetical protein
VGDEGIGDNLSILGLFLPKDVCKVLVDDFFSIIFEDTHFS